MSAAQASIAAKERADLQEAMFARRKRVNMVALTLSLLAMVFGVFWLVWILVETVRLGVGGLAWATFTEMTPPPNEVGGIANAIYGSFLMVLLATFIATPVGILAGILVDPRAATVLYGRELGVCGVCSRTLTDESSRAAGIGPVCASRF